jgi:hypothetical protein
MRGRLLGIPVAHSASTRVQSQRTQERRRALIVGCSILIAVVLGFALAIATESPVSTHLTNSPQMTSGAPDLGSAKVVIESTDGNECRQQVFDNQTWRMTRSQQPCDATARDSTGVPIPLGTIHRLDAISKSFSGKQDVHYFPSVHSQFSTARDKNSRP